MSKHPVSRAGGRGSLLLVNYHYIRDPAATRYPGIHPMAPADFAAQVRDLAGRFHMASPAEAVAFLWGERPLPGPSVLLTFDDGLKDHLWAARTVLEPLGLRGVFLPISRPLTEGRAAAVHKVHWLRAHTPPAEFRERFVRALPAEWQPMSADPTLRHEAAAMYVYDPADQAVLKFLINFRLPPELVDEIASAMLREHGEDEAVFCATLYLSREDLRAMHAAGHEIAAHGHSHTPFPRLSRAAFDAEMTTCIQTLQECTGAVPQWVSYPNGRGEAVPADADAICRRFGFRVGVTLYPGWNDGGGSPYRVKRINTNEVAEVAGRAEAPAQPQAARS